MLANEKTGNSKPTSLDDALKVLSTAIRENKKDLENRFSDEYKELRTAIADMAPQVKETFENISHEAKRIAKKGYDLSREWGHDVDEKVHHNPWPVIGGVAASTLLLGFIMGRSNRTVH